MKIKVLIVALIVLISCSNTTPKTEFPNEALSETLVSLNGEKNNFAQVLEKHKGKTIVIDVWASWCGDCIKGLPLVKALQNKEKDVGISSK